MYYPTQIIRWMDHIAIDEIGIPSAVLMENAKNAFIDAFYENCKPNKWSKILIVCGPGNNGGDGLAIGRTLYHHGYKPKIYLPASPDHLSEDAALQLNILKKLQIEISSSDEILSDRYDYIIDALFGTGMCRSLEGHYYEVIDRINHHLAYKICVDIPSGIDSDSGEILGIAVRPDLTVTFAKLKQGLRYIEGKVVLKDIGIPELCFKKAYEKYQKQKG